MEKKPAKVASSFEYESTIMDEITVARNAIGEMFEDDPDMQKYSQSAEEIAHFCEETYKKNILLLQKADEFNAVIVNNAGKINTMIKIINSDNENISELKEQYEKNLYILKTTQNTISRSKDLYKSLRKTVSELNEKVQKGGVFVTGDDQSLPELSNEVDNLKKELSKAIEESKSLKQQIKKVNEKYESDESEKLKLKDIEANVTNLIENYDRQFSSLNETVSETSDEIMKLKKSIKEKKQNFEEQKKAATEQTNTNSKLKNEKYTLLSTLTGVKDTLKTLKEQIMRKTKFLGEMQNKATIKKEEEEDVNIKISNSEKDIIEINNKFKMLCKQGIELEEKYKNEIATSKALNTTKVSLRKKVKDLRNEYMKHAFEVAQTENEVSQTQRKRVSCENQIQNEKLHIETQKKVTKEVIDQGKNLRSETFMLKEDLQTVKEKILSLYDEVDEQKTLAIHFDSKTRIQESVLKQIDQQAETHQKELEEYHLKQEHQEQLSEKLRNERNYLKRVYISVTQENEELEEQIAQLNNLTAKLEQESNEYTEKIIKDHEGSLKASNWNTFTEKENEHYKSSTLGVERIISRLQTQRQTLDFILTATQHDFIQQQKEQNLCLSNIDLIRRDIHKRKTAEADLRSEILTLERNIDKAKHVYDEKVSEMLQNRKELDVLQQKMDVLEEKKDKMKQKKFIYHRIQSDILKEKQKYSALVYEFSIPRNIHRWEVIEAIDPSYASQLRYRAAITGKLDVAHQLLISITKEKEDLKRELEARLAKLNCALTKNEVEKRIKIYENDIRNKEESIKNMKIAIGGNTSNINRSVSNIDNIRVKITAKRGTTASLRSRSNMASAKLREMDKTVSNDSGWFLTEAPAAIPFASGYIPREAPQERTVLTQSDLQVTVGEPKSFRDRKIPLLIGTKRIAKPLTPHFGKSIHMPKF